MNSVRPVPPDSRESVQRCVGGLKEGDFASGGAASSPINELETRKRGIETTDNAKNPSKRNRRSSFGDECTNGSSRSSSRSTSFKTARTKASDSDDDYLPDGYHDEECDDQGKDISSSSEDEAFEEGGNAITDHRWFPSTKTHKYRCGTSERWVAEQEFRPEVLHRYWKHLRREMRDMSVTNLVSMVLDKTESGMISADVIRYVVENKLQKKL
ncbi:hypothetical protein HK102_013020 [Quaeritorhiza haematococci]|nr:hypothetical protein HK102_013020 [Quaeritorhiza haematococci]